MNAGARFAIHNWALATATAFSTWSAPFEQASGRRVPFRIVGRRPGDVPASYADARRANDELGWRATRDLPRMCEDAWRWQSSHPDGFDA